MPSKSPQNHRLIWSDLLNDLDISSWFQVIIFLYNKEHGYSNYKNSLKRNYDQVRDEVFKDSRIKQYLSNQSEESLSKVNKVLDEMHHLLTSQCNPSRRIKYAGSFFLKCITQVYSGIYVNNHLNPPRGTQDLDCNSFKEEFLKLSEELPIVILPTHRSYMDFLLISYIMIHYELPLPIVAMGDNFKAMGSFLTNYLKSTGAFLIRRDAHRKKDVEPSVYYDILRAYVQSIIKGGENPLEFFMEGTRTRVGQVLRPKTGLLSMVVNTFIDGLVEDLYLMPVAINYQRPIEEQLYVAENTPQIGMRKPKESLKNLCNAFEAIMKRKYGKVYVRFLRPLKISECFSEWKQVTNNSIEDVNRDITIHDFTNSLACKICLSQANGNVLMPFNLIACSLLSRSFLDKLNQTIEGSNHVEANGSNSSIITEIYKVPFSAMVDDFYLIENVLKTTQDQFVPGWRRHLDIFDEFLLDRDGIVRSTMDRRYIEFNKNAQTFQTLLYYSNQLMQILLPVAICLLVTDIKQANVLNSLSHWEHYKSIRNLLVKEFFSNESFMKREFDETMVLLRKHDTVVQSMRYLLMSHISYIIRCYMLFLNYLDCDVKIFDANEFLQSGIEFKEGLNISRDMLKNMTNLVLELEICESITRDDKILSINGRSSRQDVQLKLVNPLKLAELRCKYDEALTIVNENYERFPEMVPDVNNYKRHS